jgi:hypothetical protein
VLTARTKEYIVLMAVALGSWLALVVMFFAGVHP